MLGSQSYSAMALISGLIYISRSTGSTILKIAYGYNVTSDDDPLVNIAEEAMQGFAKASEPGAFVVDRFPFRMITLFWHSASFVTFMQQ